ncbi:MAG: hypothetical protein BA874_00195 [Desulfuromonadales bacterium C00003068]|jgi:hypothetical protein|nr:MAG: hypothetical protein BA874_00195 [Desulfuromonadales bacterium C00003068]
MTELDKALELFVEDDKNQAPYYDLVLNSDFYIPVHAEEGAKGEQEITAKDSIVPLVLSAEDEDYLMLFETKERLLAWADESVCYVIVSGDAIAQMTPPKLNWALNVGTKFQKQFVPDEIAWLQEIIQKVAELTPEGGDEEIDEDADLCSEGLGES